MNIVILDACRNNPFTRSFRSGSDGLASVNAPTGTLIAYATSPGAVASDGGQSGNGVYTQELLKILKTPGLSIEEVFKRVRIAVRQRTQGRQTPWESSSLVGDFYFSNRRPAGVTPAAPAGAGESATSGRRLYESGSDTDVKESVPSPPGVPAAPEFQSGDPTSTLILRDVVLRSGSPNSAGFSGVLYVSPSGVRFIRQALTSPLSNIKPKEEVILSFACSDIIKVRKGSWIWDGSVFFIKTNTKEYAFNGMGGDYAKKVMPKIRAACNLSE